MSIEESQEPSEETEPSLFPLMGCWKEPLEDVAASLWSMVRTRDLTARDLAAVAKLIYALDRLPYPTEGIAIEASATVSHTSGRGWLTISHYGDSFSISKGETFYDPQGCESNSNSILDAEVDGCNGREDEDPITVMIELEDWVSEWSSRLLDPAYTFEIFDEFSDMDWNQPHPQNAWEMLPDGV